MKKIEVDITWMHCSSCSKIIKINLEKNKSVKSAFINVSSNKWLIEFDENSLKDEDIINIVKSSWYWAFLQKPIEFDETKNWYKKSIILFILSIPFIIFMIYDLVKWLPYNTLLMPIMALVWAVIWSIVQLFLAREFYVWAIAALKQKTFNMFSLISIWTLAAYLFSMYNFINYIILTWSFYWLNEDKIPWIYFETWVLLITFVSFWKYLETKTKQKTTESVKKLAKLAPNEVLIKSWNEFIKKEVSKAQIWDIFLVKAWEKIPCDWIIVSGNPSIDEKMLSWEANLIEKKLNDEVYAWSINQFWNFEAKITKDSKDFLVNQIINLLKETSFKKAQIENLSDKISSYFVPWVMTLALITFLVWYFIVGWTFENALIYAVSVLVIACPCALGLAVPTSIMVWTWIWANLWILIKNPDALQKANDLTAIVFDKTWTLTTWELIVEEFKNYENINDLNSVVYSLENLSNHPISKAITKYLQKNNSNLNIKNFEVINWKWISGKVWDDNYKIWNKTFVNAQNKYLEDILALEKLGKTVISISKNEQIVWYISLWDEIKSESYEIISKLQKQNIEVYIVSWDNQNAVNFVWEKLGLSKENLLWETLPQDKLEFIKKLQKSWKKVWFVWDWINDSIALTWSDLWVSLSSWSDIAMEAWDIILVKNNLNDIITSINLAKLTFSKIKQNLFFSLIYNIAWIPIAAWVFYSFWIVLKPEFAWLAMIFSSVSVVINSLLLKYNKKYISNISIVAIFIFFAWLFSFFTWLNNTYYQSLASFKITDTQKKEVQNYVLDSKIKINISESSPKIFIFNDKVNILWKNYEIKPNQMVIWYMEAMMMVDKWLISKNNKSLTNFFWVPEVTVIAILPKTWTFLDDVHILNTSNFDKISWDSQSIKTFAWPNDSVISFYYFDETNIPKIFKNQIETENKFTTKDWKNYLNMYIWYDDEKMMKNLKLIDYQYQTLDNFFGKDVIYYKKLKKTYSSFDMFHFVSK